MNVISQADEVFPTIKIMSENGNSSSDSSDKTKKINLSQARKILGVSPNKMSKLVSDGTLAFENDPLDQRVKLVLLRDVEKLKRISAKY